MAETWSSTCLFVICVCLTVLRAQNLDCDFEVDLCGWTVPSSSDRNWTRSDRASDSVGTGPDTGHTTPGRDYYIYLYAADFKRNDNTIMPGKCVLLSQDFSTTSAGGCFRFWYHMEGLGVGNLSVDVRDSSGQTTMWRQVGQKEPGWNCASFSLNENKNAITLQITAWTGPNVQGDIALDDLKLFNQRCQTIPDPCTVTPTTTSTTTSTTSTDTTTISISSSSTARSTTESNTTAKAPLATTQTPDDTSMILYIAIAPIVILVIGGVVAFICYRKRKQKDIEILVQQNNQRNNNEYGNRGYQRDVPEEEGEEVYHDLDESQMDYTGDYSLPGTQSPYNEIQPAATNGKAGMYLTMQTSIQEDAVSENSYVEPVPPPGSKGTAFGPSAGVKEQESGVKGSSNDSSAGGLHGNEAIARLQTGYAVEGRESPVPDYGDDHVVRPPKCGPTSGYIRAVYDG